jgi:hypothetical protein
MRRGETTYLQFGGGRRAPDSWVRMANWHASVRSVDSDVCRRDLRGPHLAGLRGRSG